MKKLKYNSDKLLFEKVVDKYKILSIVSLSLVVLLLLSMDLSRTIVKPKIEVVDVQLHDTTLIDTTFSEEKLIEVLDEMNVRFPHIVFAQYIQESGRGTSNIYLENHNLVGMKKAYFRPTTCVGENRGHAVYRDWKSCVSDYALWQTFTHALRYKSDEEYYMHLVRCGYAESQTYIQNLKRNSKKYYEIKNLTNNQ